MKTLILTTIMALALSSLSLWLVFFCRLPWLALRRVVGLGRSRGRPCVRSAVPGFGGRADFGSVSRSHRVVSSVLWRPLLGASPVSGAPFGRRWLLAPRLGSVIVGLAPRAAVPLIGFARSPPLGSSHGVARVGPAGLPFPAASLLASVSGLRSGCGYRPLSRLRPAAVLRRGRLGSRRLSGLPLLRYELPPTRFYRGLLRLHGSA